METKTNKAIKLYQNGDIVPAMRIFKGFRIGVNREEKRMLEIAYECLSGRSQFYMDIDICPFESISNAKLIIEKNFIHE